MCRTRPTTKGASSSDATSLPSPTMTSMSSSLCHDEPDSASDACVVDRNHRPGRRARSESASDAGVVDDDAVPVDFDVSREAPVDRLVADHALIMICADEVVALAVCLHSEVGYRDPSRGELERIAAREQTVAQYGHQIGHGGES